MPRRFATARRRECAVVARVLTAPRHPCAANDAPDLRAQDLRAQDFGRGQDFARRALLRDALRHFAAHGTGAAELAWINAEQAFFADRLDDYLHWMAICRALDRRMVDATRMAPSGLR